MDTAVFHNQKRANVCEHTTKMESVEFLKGAIRGLQMEWMEGNLKGDYLRLMSRGQNELVVAPLKNSSDAIFVVCSHIFTLF